MSEEIKIGESYKHSFCFESLGVKFRIDSNLKTILDRVKGQIPAILPIKWRETGCQNIKHRFSISRKSETKTYCLKAREQVVLESPEFKDTFERLTSNIRLTLAEFTQQKIFLHAGVIGFEGSAVVIPGKSFAGKTTLVAEFTKRGFKYLSDEYALLDKKGLVHPFPKKLSIRGIIDDYQQVDFDVEKIGGQASVKPLPLKFILLTEYKKGTSAQISETSAGEGLMHCIANSISIRQNPQLVLSVLNKAVSQSKVLKGSRGEASDFIKIFVEYTENLHRGKKKRNEESSADLGF